jgi:hypothetical protein
MEILPNYYDDENRKREALSPELPVSGTLKRERKVTG